MREINCWRDDVSLAKRIQTWMRMLSRYRKDTKALSGGSKLHCDAIKRQDSECKQRSKLIQAVR